MRNRFCRLILLALIAEVIPLPTAKVTSVMARSMLIKQAFKLPEFATPPERSHGVKPSDVKVPLRFAFAHFGRGTLASFVQLSHAGFPC